MKIVFDFVLIKKINIYNLQFLLTYYYFFLEYKSNYLIIIYEYYLEYYTINIKLNQAVFQF
jgi:hypothetical protein